MAAIGIAILLLMILLVIGGGILLYTFVRAEHDNRQRMARTDAECQARRDTSDYEDR